MFTLQRKQTFCRRMALVFLILIINEILTPSVALALTGGPSQPEVHGFEPVGTSDMVDLSTGDFNYNIPLMDAGGYPINISYHAGASADDEGSWVGLGWSLTPGAMNRDMRGLPDDFKGDKIKKEFNIKPDITTGINAGLKFQFLGLYKPPSGLGTKATSADLSIGLDLGGFYNNHKGFGIEYGISPNLSLGKVMNTGTAVGKPDSITRISPNLNLGASLKYNSQSGLDADLSVGLSGVGLGKLLKKASASANVGIGFNSRQGLKDLTFGTSLNTVSKYLPSRFSNSSASGSISFSSRTYVPTNAMPMMNTSGTFQGTGGTAWWTTHPALQITGYQTRQELSQKQQFQAAYGYLNSQSAQKDRSALMDYNKEKQIPYRPSQPNLPLSVGTYDLFSATGQGVSGQFRAMRNDVGTFRTPNHVNASVAATAGGEFGGGGLIHGGLEIKGTSVVSTAGDWSGGKGAADYLGFTSQTGSAESAAYEPVFIKNTGESATSSIDNSNPNSNFTKTIGGNTPIALKVKTDKGVVADNVIRKESDGGNIKSELAISGTVRRDKREKRTQVFSYLTAAEATKVGLDKTIKSYPINECVVVKSGTTQPKIETYQRVNESTEKPIKETTKERPAHHISEVSVTQGDGSRYVYGIPAYNTTQEEASFAVNSDAKKTGTLVEYNRDIDNSINNTQGRDNYYDSQTLPPYAHSYLLTGVVSSDYVDVKNDGITDDDIGTNVKINYTRALKDYAWRTPYGLNQARFNEGYKTDGRDDKASYVYGQKEVWYTHSVETKTMVAQFFLEDREDGLGVNDRNGGKNSTKKLKYLAKIELYSKAALLAGDKTPIKTVHFRYDYSLGRKTPGAASTFKNVPNTTDENKYGKLTLRKIYFTYGNNTSGKLNAYKFRYNGDGATESTSSIKMQYGLLPNSTPNIEDIYQVLNSSYCYDIDNYDRWGSYKEASANPNSIENKYFPYATQNKALADAYANGWNLNKIELPSGGLINVKYESDDYAYVQDKRAGQMFPIKGFSRGRDDTPDNQLYVRQYNPLFPIAPAFVSPVFGVVSKYIHVDISQYKALDLADFKKRYLEDVKQMYFNCVVNVQDSKPELIKGYFDIDNVNDIKLANNNTIAVIPMVFVNSDLNPVGKIALQTLRLELPFLVYPGYEDQGGTLENMLGTLFGIFPEIRKLQLGFEAYAVEKGWVLSVDISKSWVRLANPNYTKLGGGSRVAEITVNNYNSTQTTGTDNPNNTSYGQRYIYSTPIVENGVVKEVRSNGVASYEPMVGNEENLFRNAMNYDQKVALAPDNTYYMETPFGESLFPGANVVYSSVKVQSIEPAGLKRTGTGYTIHEFFTAKDFPTVVDYTEKNQVKYPTTNASFSLLNIFKINSKEHIAVSQGYTIEVNDMHGKPKAEYVRNAYGADISWTKYDYRTDGSNHIKNDEVDVVKTDGSIRHDGVIGYDMDVWHDMQQDKTETTSMGMSANGEMFLIPFTAIPVFIPPFIPSLNRQETIFRSAVTTKFVKRFGILNKVTKMENGSTVSTENLLFDSETGQPLLTKTQNEFRDEMYQFSYPAHWAYDDGMGQAYKNIGLKADGVVIGSDGAVPSTFSNYFVPGDDLIIEKAGSLLPNRYNIVMVGGAKKVVDPNGDLLAAGTYSLKVMRSGRRNQASAAIGSVVSRKDPRQGNTLVFDNQILTAQAATFKDDWAINTGKALFCTNTVINTPSPAVEIPKPGETFDQYPGLLQLLQNCTIVQNGTTKTVSEVVGRPIPNFIGNGSSDNMICYWSGGPKKGDACPKPYVQASNVVFNVKLSETCNLEFYGYGTNDYLCSEGTATTSTNRVSSNWLTARAIWQTYIYLNCTTTTVKTDCVLKCANGQQVNPYQLGIKGNWRPDAAYALYTQRTAPLSVATKKIRTDGDVVAYDNFWVWNNGKLGRPTAMSSKWVKTNTIDHYDDKGNDIENHDALGIYSSALFRYKNTLASAVAANARRREIAFDGFEDYGFTTTNVVEELCDKPHFDFLLPAEVQSKLSMKKAHTGNYSVLSVAGSPPIQTRDFNAGVSTVNDNKDNTTDVVEATDHRIVKRSLPQFALDKKKAYILSAWVSKEGLCTPTTMQGIKMNVVVTYPTKTVTIPCSPVGTIVEGWQRIETAFTTEDADISSVKVQFVNDSGSDAYMDDLRILPTEGKMKSFVYDAKTLRLMAQLDENNYATFYEYDDEGTLVRTKRETERGVVTIQENRSTLYRKQQ
jgi:hypothetical protein